MLNLPPALVFIGGALVLPVLPRRLRPWWFLLTAAAALALISQLQPGASLHFHYLHLETFVLQ